MLLIELKTPRAEVVKADIADTASLTKVFQGAFAEFISARKFAEILNLNRVTGKNSLKSRSSSSTRTSTGRPSVTSSGSSE